MGTSPRAHLAGGTCLGAEGRVGGRRGGGCTYLVEGSRRDRESASSLGSWRGQRDDGRSGSGARAGQRLGNSEQVGAKDGGQRTLKFGGCTAMEDVDPHVDAWS